MKIAVSADSTCAITQERSKKLDIYILPLNVIVDGHEYHDNISINQTKLKEMMRRGSRIQTSTPTTYEIESYFDKIFAQGYDKIIHFTISSKLSNMYNLFKAVCKEKYGNKIEVIDTLSVCSFMGNIVRYAKRLVDEKNTFKNIITLVKKRINKDEIYFVPESLTFLKNGGRVSVTAALIGNMFGIKPLLKFSNGEILKQGSVLTLKKAFSEALDIVKSSKINPTEYEFHIVEFDAKNAARQIKNMIHKNFPEYSIVHSSISINVCAHCGPGTVGFGCCKKSEN